MLVLYSTVLKVYKHYTYYNSIYYIRYFKVKVYWSCYYCDQDNHKKAQYDEYDLWIIYKCMYDAVNMKTSNVMQSRLSDDETMRVTIADSS